jgi:hypothetical protein
MRRGGGLNAKLNTKLVVEPVVPSANLIAKLVVELIVEPTRKLMAHPKSLSLQLQN